MPTQNSALAQTFQKQQAAQKGNPQEAKEAMQALLQKPEVQAMLTRLRNKWNEPYWCSSCHQQKQPEIQSAKPKILKNKAMPRFRLPETE